MNEKEWRQLVNNALNNDEAAFERLYKETERSVYFLCLKLLGNEQDAKDAAQETYLAAFNGLSSLDDGANFPKWINGIAVNQCKRFFRTPQNESLDEKLEHGVDFSDDENFIPDDYVANAEKRKVIMNMIDKELSEVQRQTIILYYYNGLKTNEIASIMNCPEGTVKYRLSAARDKIKEAVLIYEKKNKDRLHAIVPIPILTLILRSEAEHTVVPNVRLFHNPAASAKHLKTGGKAIMKKALTGKVIAAAAAVVVVGGGITAAIALNKNNDSNISEQDSGSSNVILENSDSSDTDNSPTDNSSESTTDTQTEPETEPELPKTRAVGGSFRLYIPSSFEDMLASDRGLFKQTLENGDEVYFLHSAAADYAEARDDNDFTEYDVPAILQDRIYTDIKHYYPSYKENLSFTTETEEPKTVLDFPFLFRTGMMHTEMMDKIADLHYAAYYGVVTYAIYDIEKAPIQWLAFCDTDDPDTIQHLEELVHNAAESAELKG